ETQLVYRQDFVEYAGTKRNTGQIEGDVTVIIAGELTLNRYGELTSLLSMDVSDQVLVFLSESDAAAFDSSSISMGGMLIIADEAADLSRRSTLTTGGPTMNLMTGRALERHDYPKLWITRAVATRLLGDTDKTLADLYREAESLGLSEIIELHTDLSASILVQDTAYSETVANHVIGFWPGTMGGEALGRQDLSLDNHMIVVMAKYDAPPLSPDGAFYPGANDNASAVAVMLETISALQESDYQPYRTLLFVAYSGEGYEGGHTVLNPEGSEFLKAARGFSSAYELEVVIRLRALGAGDGEGIALYGGGNLRLIKLFEESASRMGSHARPVNEVLDVGIIFQDKSFREGGQETPGIGLSWQGWGETAGLVSDTIDSLSSDKMEEAGRSLALALMILG
ncbi:M28 family peptidase, partial [Candidatus Bipolaricaulota bacterium]|nr:M28 family peptidase [Candidatus Bipolaricaulota bacterium]